MDELTRDMLDRVAREVARIRERMPSAAAHAGTGRANLPADHLQNALLARANQLQALSSNPDLQVGRMPPEPPTVRGRLGAVLVRAIRRALFWYTRQINEIAGNIAEILVQHAQNIEDTLVANARNSHALADLQYSQTALRATTQRLETGLDQLTSRATNAAQDIATLRENVRSQEDRLRQLSGAITALQSAMEWQKDADRKIESTSAATDSIANDLELLRAEGNRREARWNEITGRIREMQLYAQSIRAELAVERSRVSLLMQQRQPAPTEKALPVKQSSNLGAELGLLYLQFENAFRGSRGEIKARAAEYLPLLRDKGIGTVHMPVLDLGCGRGEWLELLSENGVTASGVESNAAFVEECRTRGFAVHHSDAIRFLQELLPESQGAVTGFHVIEHLPFSSLLTLLDEAVRVLKPGGILMLETPNPANLTVGAHTFYLDPTHVRPLPADLMRFLVEARGFCNARILPLHPFAECYRLDQTDNPAAEALNRFLYGPRDYMVVGERL